MICKNTHKEERKVAMSESLGALYGKGPKNDKTHEEMLRLLAKLD